MDQLIDLIDVAAKSYPLKALAQELDKGESTLRNELTQQPGYKLGLTTSILIMKKTGDLRPLDRIESFFNRVAFILPEASDSSLPVMQLAGKLTREFGEHMEALASALEDGTINRKEAENCLKELRDVIEACVGLQAYLEKIL